MPVVSNYSAGTGGFDVWPTWSGTTISVTAATTNTTGTTIALPAWSIWNQQTSSLTTSTNAIYANWVEDVSQLVARVGDWGYPPRRLAKPSEAEVRAQLAHEQRYRDAELAREAARKAAREKAAGLLEEHLTEEQVAHLRARDCFYLETLGQDGKKNRYRIDRGTHGNVKRVDEKGSILESLCIQPGGVPTEDAMLAQKLWLETDEAAFRKVANITRVR